MDGERRKILEEFKKIGFINYEALILSAHKNAIKSSTLDILFENGIYDVCIFWLETSIAELDFESEKLISGFTQRVSSVAKKILQKLYQDEIFMKNCI